VVEQRERAAEVTAMQGERQHGRAESQPLEEKKAAEAASSSRRLGRERSSRSDCPRLLDAMMRLRG